MKTAEVMRCGLCSWYLSSLNVTYLRYASLIHMAHVHPVQFREVVGREPAGAIDEYRRDLVAAQRAN